MSDDDESLRGRVQRTGEDVLGRLAQDLLSNPLMTGAVQRALETREKATQAQEVAMGALNLPSAADVERLTRRVRSVSQRLEAIEDAIDRLDDRLAGTTAAAREAGDDDVVERLGRIESALEVLTARGATEEAGTIATAKRAPAKRATAKRTSARAGSAGKATGRSASTKAAPARGARRARDRPRPRAGV